MGLMGSLYLGNSGLLTSQNALNTTAHNLSNVDTAGYTRQQVQLATSSYNPLAGLTTTTSIGQVGLGVTYTQTRQVRDVFLDRNYRKESGRSNFYDISSTTLNYVEDILGESAEGKSFSTSISDLWTAVEELTKDPCNQVNQNLFVTRSYEFLTNAQNVYESLCSYQLNMNETVKNYVNQINRDANRIEELNNEIVMIESGGFEHANDLRDERNALIDSLAKQGNVTWSEDVDGYVSIQFEGVDLVKGGIVNEIGLYEDTTTGFVTPYWTQNASYTYNQVSVENPDGTFSVGREKVLVEESVKNAQLYDLTQRVSSDHNTDVGGLRATLLARGDHQATYEDILDADYYNENIEQSVMMNVQAEFDQLIHNVVDQINGILKDAADSAGAYPDSTYLRDENGDAIQMFELRANDVDANNDPLTTVGNLVINQKLRQTPSLLNFRLPDGSEDQETMEKLKAAFEAYDYTLNPNVATPVNFRNYYNSLVTQVSNSGSVYSTILQAQEVTVNNIGSAREQILGVSSDEELTYMIQFQNAYNAASRYINVINEMIEHVVSTLGA